MQHLGEDPGVRGPATREVSSRTRLPIWVAQIGFDVAGVGEGRIAHR